MIQIIIIEDDPQDLAQLQDCLRRFEEEQHVRFALQTYTDPKRFLQEYRPGADLVFMDIQLPHFNGMDAARKLREVDPDVGLVFITNMEQFAVNGYEVDALDFVVKPINALRFSSMLRKALRRIAQRGEKELVIQSSGTIRRVKVSQVRYVEIRDHLLLYHTDAGRLESWGKLSEVEEELTPYHFVRCSSSCLVNLRHVVSVDGNTVKVGDASITVSIRRRKAFLAAVTDYLSGK